MVFPLIPLAAAAITGGAGLIGGMMQNAANKEAANTQMAFQKEMNTHAYRYAVEDMKAAGINPMLAYQQGGANSASGASYVANNVGDAMTSAAVAGANSAKQANMMQTEIANIEADSKLKDENAKAAQAAVIQSLSQAQLNNQNSATVAAMRAPIVADAVNKANISAGESLSADILKEYLKSDAGKLARTLSIGGQDAAGTTSAIKNFNLLKWW